MPRKNGHVPAYRPHKPSGQARVIINHEHIYLGKFGSAESREKYARLIAELNANGRSPSGPPAITRARLSCSVNELILTYWHFAKAHYIKDGKPTDTLPGVRAALRPVRQIYGLTAANEFGPMNLKTIRHQFVQIGLSRGVVNKRIGQIKRMFKWAVAEELIPPSVYHGLQAVSGLTFGRSAARETEPIHPVPDLYVAAVLPFLSPHVAAMVKVQRLTGMRAGELVVMRPCDIDTSGDIWIYEPFDHKNHWRGHRKQIPLGPEAQRLLQPFLDRDPQAFLFSPQESERWRLEHRPPYKGRQRKTPLYPSELRRRAKLKEARRQNRQPKRPKRERYDTNSYRGAINYGLLQAKKAGFVIPHWHPHQLRHRGPPEVRHRGGAGGVGARAGGRNAGVRRAEPGAGQGDREGDGVRCGWLLLLFPKGALLQRSRPERTEMLDGPASKVYHHL